MLIKTPPAILYCPKENLVQDSWGVEWRDFTHTVLICGNCEEQIVPLDPMIFTVLPAGAVAISNNLKYTVRFDKHD